MPAPREFNKETERVAAAKRARVAASVNKQEWLDEASAKAIEVGGPGDDDDEDDDDRYSTEGDHGDDKSRLLAGMPPPDSNVSEEDRPNPELRTLTPTGA